MLPSQDFSCNQIRRVTAPQLTNTPSKFRVQFFVKLVRESVKRPTSILEELQSEHILLMFKQECGSIMLLELFSSAGRGKLVDSPFQITLQGRIKGAFSAPYLSCLCVL